MSDNLNIRELGQYKVGNIVLPYPKSAQVSVMSLQGDTARNLNGVMIFDIIRPIMYKIQLEFPPMTADQVKLVVSAFAGNFGFQFTFLNTLTNKWDTIEAYTGDITANPKILKYNIVKVPNTNPVEYEYQALYEGISVNVIQV